MRKRQRIWMIGMLACALSGAWAQDSSTPPEGTPPPTQQEPVPAYGQENAPPAVSENPPISGLDLPSLEPHAAPLSYIQAGATVSESADSNVFSGPGSGPGFTSVSRGLASITMQRLWSNYDLALDYVGGAGYYSSQGQGAKLLQQMDIQQKVAWKRGQLSLRDSFSYLPEGNFGGSYGSLGSQGIGSLGSTSFSGLFGGSSLGALGLVPRILNVSIADVTENLTPKSSVTAAGGYAFTHFYGNNASTGPSLSGVSFIGSSQVSAQGAYDRVLTTHTQVALAYAYQGFDFSAVGAAFHSHIIEGLYGRRITGRMDLLLGAGPQITKTGIGCTLTDFFLGNPHCGLSGGLPVGSIPDTRIGVAAQARLRYKFTRTALTLSYQRYESSGSGLFAGAQSDVARLNAERPLSRVWTVFADMGYSRNSRLQSLTAQQAATCIPAGQPQPNPPEPVCPGISANTYNYGFVGGGLHRAFGHDFHGYASYQFNELSFDHSYCGGVNPCSRISNRQIITFGLDWTPRPIRLD